MQFLQYFKQLKAGQIAQISVFTGSEIYHIDHTIKYIEANFLNQDYKSFNISLIEGATDIDDLIGLATTLPLFDEKRLIVLSKTGLLKQIKESAESELLSFLKNLPEHLILIFNEQELDKRKKLCKWLKNEAEWIEFSKLNHSEFIKWCQKRFVSYKQNISTHALNYFVERIDYLDPVSKKNLYDVDNVIKTLSGRSEIVDANMINEYVEVPLEHNIFKLMDAMSSQNMGLAVQILNDFTSTGEPPIKIFALMSQQIRNIYKIKCLLESGYTSTTAATKLEIHPFVSKKAAQFAKNFTKSQLVRIIEILEKTDVLLKSTNVSATIIIEKALLDMSVAK